MQLCHNSEKRNWSFLVLWWAVWRKYVGIEGGWLMQRTGKKTCRSQELVTHFPGLFMIKGSLGYAVSFAKCSLCMGLRGYLSWEASSAHLCSWFWSLTSASCLREYRHWLGQCKHYAHLIIVFLIENQWVSSLAGNKRVDTFSTCSQNSRF